MNLNKAFALEGLFFSVSLFSHFKIECDLTKYI